MEFRFRQTRYPLIDGIAHILLVLGGLATWAMIDIPFGGAFKLAFHLAYAGLVLSLLLPGVRLFVKRTPWRMICGGLLMMISLLFSTLLTVLHIDYTLLPIIQVTRSLEAQEWRADLAYLAKELPAKHPDLFSLVGEKEFREEITRLESRIGELDETRLRAEVARIVALADDGHTYPNIFSLNLDWHLYPLATHLFPEGMYILDAGREHQDLIGSRIELIDGVPMAEVLNAIDPYLSSESPHMDKERRNNSFCVAEWLYAAGVTASPHQAIFTVENAAGQRNEVTLQAVHYLQVGIWAFLPKADDDVISIAIKNERESRYRLEHLDESNTLYFQFNQVVEEGEEESLAEFTERMSAVVDEHDFDRFVIDIRNNDGGNGTLLPPLVRFLAGNEKINRPGRLYLLTSQRSFSAAAMFAAMMQNNTEAILVGQGTSQGPNFFSQPHPIRLPHSGMEFLVSRAWSPSSPSCDHRNFIEPDLPVAFTWDDHVSGRDPGLAIALAHEMASPELPAPEAAEAARVVGSYRLSLMEKLEIRKERGGLRILVTDFLENSKVRVDKELFQAEPGELLDRRGALGIRVPEGDGPAASLIFICYGSELEIPRLASGEVYGFEMFQSDRIEEGIAAIVADREAYAEAVPHLENFLNLTGYDHLRGENYRAAISLFRLNVELFPGSSNVHDSLGEAFMLDGQRESAIRSYQRSLELNPENENAREKLQTLQI